MGTDRARRVVSGSRPAAVPNRTYYTVFGRGWAPEPQDHPLQHPAGASGARSAVLSLSPSSVLGG